MTEKRNSETEDIEVLVNEAESLGFIMLYTPILYDRRLNNTQRMLWCILKRYRGNNATCFPGVTRLSKALGMDKRSVYKHIEKLEEVGLVVRKRRPGHSNLYDLPNIEKVYCNGDKQLLDDILEMLREAGEEKTVERILEVRKRFEDENKPKQKSVSQAKKTSETVVVPLVKKRNLEESLAKAKEQQTKSDKAAKRRNERNIKLAQDPNYQKSKIGTREDGEVVLTVKDVEDEWKVAAKEKWPDAPSTYSVWSAQDKGIAKRLCDRYGHESVIKVIITVISEWESYVDRFDLNGYPNMKLVAGFADSWFPEIESGRFIDPRSKRDRAQAQGEYDEATGSDSGGIRFL